MSPLRLLRSLLFALLATALAQEQADLRPKLTIVRDDTTILVIQDGPSASGARTIPRNGACREGVKLGTVYVPQESGVVETFIRDTRITSAIALLEQPDDPDEAETLELTGGSLSFDDSYCPTEIERASEPSVFVYEGRSTIQGSRVLYDNGSGLSVVEGPLDLERAARGESPPLSALAERLEFETDSDTKLLSGGVRVESEDRVSEADTLELNEKAGIAILRGNASSTRGTEVVRGEVIEYDIDSNDVVVSGALSGTFQFER